MYKLLKIWLQKKYLTEQWLPVWRSETDASSHLLWNRWNVDVTDGLEVQDLSGLGGDVSGGGATGNHQGGRVSGAWKMFQLQQLQCSTYSNTSRIKASNIIKTN